MEHKIKIKYSNWLICPSLRECSEMKRQRMALKSKNCLTFKVKKSKIKELE